MIAYIYFLVISCVFYLKQNANADHMKYTDMKGLDDLSHLSNEKVMDILGMNIQGAKERLEKIFHIIDKNNDMILSDAELEIWSNFVKNEVFLKQVQVEMKQIDSDKDGFISLAELNDAFSQNLDEKEVEKHSEGLLKRFQIVDKDKDSKLNINEVGLLIDPVKDEELKELEISEILDHHDINKDGKISLEEFKQTRTDDPNSKKDDDVALDDFNFFDSNKDGFIDKEEIIKVYFDPSHETGSININEIKDGIFEGKEISYDLWNEKALKIAVTSLTDYGDIIRFPEDFKLDIGKNVVLPSSKGHVSEEEDLDQDELETEDNKNEEQENDETEEKEPTTDEL
ncbi:endoplasmic reticulum-resident calcium binding protein, putative [Plasmodium gallinaceum]|uniref:Endoplasmic reticulum-resident calcium binding protein, putative n=1 Tax=Plasmodium gallinaceum TaxID=5849 RepID=A0A1J1GXY7_PLAGA|nr:endoplasmic reticulum-resident calcium binding protein, putative [Plasmodium gallinaceum]CRG96144.1 endoplasmic reticulum-resident calcium binding protein, putative [Plasmodium gallinaceum]